jgi:hypothetical protein
MTDLSPGTRHIVSEGVRALEPSQAARDRIRAGVAARVSALPGTGGGGESGPSGASASAATGMGAIAKASLLAVIGAVVVGGGFVWFAGGDAPAERAARPAVATPAGPAAPPTEAATEPATEPRPAPAPAATAGEDRPDPPVAAHRRKPADRRRDGAAKTSTGGGDDDLAREVRLLDRARRALAGGDVDAARDALARYRRDIAAPQMERESLLLRAETQCAAAETEGGLRTLAAVERRWPGASGVDAVRALCREAP